MTSPGPVATEPPRTSAMATWSLISSALGFFCFWGLGGLVGIALGVMAKGEIERSDGRFTGSGLANAGIALGALNLIAAVAALGAAIALVNRPSSPSAPPSLTATATATVLPAPHPPPKAAAPPATPGRGGASREPGTVVTTVGDIVLVDLDSGSAPLRDALDAQRSLARAEGQTLVVWLVAPDCQPCNGVAAALPDPLMQKALARVRLVRIDVRASAFELQRQSMPVAKIPGFVLLGADDRPADYVHGGEWDEDVAANIAPVLGGFVRGSYKNRRDPWQGARRDDETAL